MNAISFGFGTAARESRGEVPDGPGPDQSLDTAWIVLEAANDLGDDATVEVCRRVIDANLKGRPASQSDVHIVLDYFR
jgi:hypothetical protein